MNRMNKPVKLIPDPSKSHRPRGERRLKAVAVLPSLATLGNLLCGFGAIYMCVLSADWRGADLARPTLNNPRFEAWFPTYLAIGAYLILLSMVLDALDGRLARLARKTSDFGAQLDSLSDVVSFGVAPALLVMCIIRPIFGGSEVEGLARVLWRVQWVALAVYPCCAAVRLARFNVENVADESAHRSFKGLPSPGAAAAVVSIVILHEEYIRDAMPQYSRLVSHLSVPLVFICGLLMVSRFKYPHFVNTFLRGRRPLSHIIAILAVVLAMAMIDPRLTFALLACGYALWGPVLGLVRRASGRPMASTSGLIDGTDSAARDPSASQAAHRGDPAHPSHNSSAG